MLLLAYVFGIIGGVLLLFTGLIYISADDSDAKAWMILPVYLSFIPLALCGICVLIHRL